MKSIVGILLAFYLSGAVAADPFWQQGVSDDSYSITVYRSPTCGCCKNWIAHLRQHNFRVEDVPVASVDPYKRQYRVPPRAASCHTAVVDGVAIEGHVPAQDIKRLLSAEHDIRLLTVPSMPSGTPGMDLPGAPRQDFKVFAVGNDDQVSIFNEYTNY